MTRTADHVLRGQVREVPLPGHKLPASHSTQPYASASSSPPGANEPSASRNPGSHTHEDTLKSPVTTLLELLGQRAQVWLGAPLTRRSSHVFAAHSSQAQLATIVVSVLVFARQE